MQRILDSSMHHIDGTRTMRKQAVQAAAQVGSANVAQFLLKHGAPLRELYGRHARNARRGGTLAQ
ncbi:hypothetical protein AUI51_03065 [archaeon 13_1_40CM_2_52_4]|nr:MAG: hypothetical protein AUI51_03065 [archaeon 13_1_40CM_2_52_4]